VTVVTELVSMSVWNGYQTVGVRYGMQELPVKPTESFSRRDEPGFSGNKANSPSTRLLLSADPDLSGLRCIRIFHSSQELELLRKGMANSSLNANANGG
jgi:hypothetical protein